jgi:2,4-dichlorophenol 6-monooxygenase
VAQGDVPLDAIRIGHLDADLFDPRCTWLRHRGIGADGAVLVRPDRFVAWRSLAVSEDSRSELATALGHILGRSLEARVPVGASAV